MQALKASIHGSFGDILKHRVQVLDTIIMSSTPCETAMSPIDLHIHMTLYINDLVNQDLVENTLLLITTNTTNIHNEKKGILAEIRPTNSNKHILLPSIIQKIDYRSNCFIKHTSQRMHYANVQQRVTSKSLFCYQVEFEKKEYEFGTSRLSVYVMAMNETFPPGSYQILKSGILRLCLVDILNVSFSLTAFGSSLELKTESDSSVLVRDMELYTCIFAIACITLALVLYKLSASLRTQFETILKLVLMCLLVEQFLTLIESRVSFNSTPCILIGFFHHIFTLCVYSLILLCTIQTLRLHIKKCSESESKNKLECFCDKKSVICHIVIVLIPVLVAGLNIFVARGVQSFELESNSNCFLQNNSAYILTFVMPVVLLLVLSFIILSLIIVRYRNRSSNVTTFDSDDYLFCALKLCLVLTLNVIIQILDHFHHSDLSLTLLSFCRSVLGIVILFLFVFRRNACIQSKRNWKTKSMTHSNNCAE